MNDLITVAIRWSPYTENYFQSSKTITATTATTVTLTGGFRMGTAPGAALPALGTIVKIWPGSSGWQEIDGDVVATAIRKGNRLASGTSWAAQESLGGDTLPDSYTFASKPAIYGSMTWPMDPAEDTFPTGININPATYLFFHGELPAAESGGTPTYQVGKLRFLRR
jgi:hypothetical protein